MKFMIFTEKRHNKIKLMVFAFRRSVIPRIVPWRERFQHKIYNENRYSIASSVKHTKKLRGNLGTFPLDRTKHRVCQMT